MLKVWALLDDRAGNNNQVLAVAEALDIPFEEKKIQYNKFVKLPNFLRQATTLGIDKGSLNQFELPLEDLPDLIIGAGRRMYPLMRYLKKKKKGNMRLVQIMNPGKSGFKEADLVVLPRHDNYKGYSKNVFFTLGAPNRVTKERLQAEQEKWRSVFEAYPQPRVSVIVGGATKKSPFTIQMAEQLALDVLALEPGSLLITTSRRTPTEVVQKLKAIFPKENTYFYQYGDERENPYFGLLSWGSRIVVTGDSMSMCSEACCAGVPVYIFAPNGSMGKKHQLFHKQLYKSGYATALGSGQIAFGGILNAANEVAERVKTLIETED